MSSQPNPLPPPAQVNPAFLPLPKPTKANWLAFWLLSAVVVAGLWPVLSSSVNVNEARYWKIAALPLSQMPFAVLQQHLQSLLYPVVLSSMVAVGDTVVVVWLRLMLFVNGLFWLFRLGSLRSAGLGLWMVVVFGGTVGFLSQILEPSGPEWLATVFVLASFYYLFHWYHSRRMESLLSAHVLLVFLLLSHPVGWVGWAGFNGLFLATRWRKHPFYKVFAKRWWLLQLALVAITLPWWIAVGELYR